MEEGKGKEMTVAVLRTQGNEATDRIPFLGSAIRGSNQLLPVSRPGGG